MNTLEALAWRAEQAGLNAAASPRETLIDGWLLRLSPGAAKRSRCVNALGTTGQLPLDDLLRRCRQSFQQAGLPLILRMTPFSQPAELDDWLAARQWRAFDPADVMVLPTLDAFAAMNPADNADDASVEALSPEVYAAQVGAMRGSSEEEIQGHAARLTSAPVPHQAFCLRDVDAARTPLAYGQIAVDGTIVGLFDILTPPQRRGRGYGRRLCIALLAIARQQGATEAYLQVGADNVPAQRLYSGLGFQTAYRYHYRSDDPKAWS
ncbi:Acetyltransferase (GNAT) family protein [Roseateles sp. YR242]|uniref:GNAT family N-acetyltransferase n=1 Tax=Roseateles sp. YR242 TaxID=1855305 RepID=UPI0008AC5D18|nr:GNAT family N-acetyltransferase [Roseateles sp. YR242]SEK85658.1 Acetyltransferase (GNAT) family protein [Roseateles sp. YR242]